MYPILRYTKSIIDAVRDNKKQGLIDFADTGEIEIYCQPTDIDNFFEMNNGRIFTLFDLGRIDFAVRTGLGKALIKNRWGLVVAGSTIQYRKRIRLFDKVTMKTHIAGFDERWVYIEQSMWVKGKPCSTALLRTGVTEKGRVIATERVLKAVGKGDWQKPPTGYVAEWIACDDNRPWSPEY